MLIGLNELRVLAVARMTTVNRLFAFCRKIMRASSFFNQTSCFRDCKSRSRPAELIISHRASICMRNCPSGRLARGADAASVYISDKQRRRRAHMRCAHGRDCRTDRRTAYKRRTIVPARLVCCEYRRRALSRGVRPTTTTTTDTFSASTSTLSQR